MLLFDAPLIDLVVAPGGGGNVVLGRRVAAISMGGPPAIENPCTSPTISFTRSNNFEDASQGGALVS